MSKYGKKPFWKSAAKYVNDAISGLSAEYVLRYLANGGTAVMIRTIIISAEIYIPAIAICSWTRDDATLAFSSAQAIKEVHESFPWLGAIAAAVYAALYSRFAAQWSYLAGLYNQIMTACVSSEIMDKDHLESESMIFWQAAFIEDAEDLHLATKGQFAPALHQMLSDPRIRKAYIVNTENGAMRLRDLEDKLISMLGVEITIRKIA